MVIVQDFILSYRVRIKSRIYHKSQWIFHDTDRTCLVLHVLTLLYLDINVGVQDLERKLANVLRQSFQHCPTIGSQLRLLEVFEGISGRELVQVGHASYLMYVYIHVLIELCHSC